MHSNQKLIDQTIVTLVCRNSTLAKIAKHLRLDSKVKIRPPLNSKPEHERTKILADLFEARIAACWEEYHPQVAMIFIKEMLQPICYWILEEIRKGNLWTRAPPKPTLV